MKKLSKSQEKILHYIKECAQIGVPPSVREICDATGLKSTSTVHSHLRTLEDLGYISRGAGRNRSITLNGVDKTIAIPVLGRVTAGVPILAIEDVQSYIPLYESEVKGRELFALTVVGESMKNAGILNGDIIICQKTPIAEDGDIVVALMGDEATVKRFFKEGSYVRLQPENPDFEPIITNDLTILGKVISLMRNY